MGLDNTLAIKGKTLRGNQFLDKTDNYLKHEGQWYEFGYWRKCWNIRSKFLEVFNDRGYDGQGGDLPLKVSDLIEIRNIMKYFLIEENWSKDGNSSIWTWSQSICGIAKCLTNIDFFIEDFMERQADVGDISEEDFELVFEDSY